MRLIPVRANPWRMPLVLGCVLVAALCYSFFPARALGLSETTNASLWACVTLATMSLVYYRRPH